MSPEYSQPRDPTIELGGLHAEAQHGDQNERMKPFLCNEEELVAEKMKVLEAYPPSPDLRFSLQVIAYNEMPNHPEPTSEFPNLALNLRSVVTAVENYVKKGGKASEIEILYNINNNPFAQTLANERSINFLKAILSETPAEELLTTFDWVPKDNGDRRIHAVRDFYIRLIRDARSMMNEGFHILPVDSTDGRFIAKKKNEKDPQTDHPTQGARRRLLGSIAYERFKTAMRLSNGKNDISKQFMMPMDADVYLHPTYFVEMDNLTSQHLHGQQPLLLHTQLRLNAPRGFYGNDLLKVRDDEGIPVIETFTGDQLVKMARISRNELDLNNLNNVRNLLTRIGLTPLQIDFITSIEPSALEALIGFSGDLNNEDYPLNKISSAIGIFNNSESGTARRRFTTGYRNLKTSLKGLLQNATTGGIFDKVRNFISSDSRKNISDFMSFVETYVSNTLAYEKSGGWDISKDLGEDLTYKDTVCSLPNVHAEYIPVNLTHRRDRSRPDSWFGGNIAVRQTSLGFNITEPEWQKVVTYIRGQYNLGEDIHIDLTNLPDIVFSILNTQNNRFNENERNLLETLNSRMLTGKKVDAVSNMGGENLKAMIQLVRTVEQYPFKYKNLKNFFITIAEQFDRDP